MGLLPRWSPLAVMLIFVGTGCDVPHTLVQQPPKAGRPFRERPPIVVPKALDVLFVIDNSDDMLAEQKRLVENFPRLLLGLQTAGAFGSGLLPNLHIGVISSDLGAGPYSLPGCRRIGGDGGRLRAPLREPGCRGSTLPWIGYIEGRTNIEGCNAQSAQDAIRCVISTFGCMAELGNTGCSIQMPLEAARRALDPLDPHQANPGFLRDEADLALVFVTSGDDCSTRHFELFDPSPQATDILGPPTSFRCFEFGVQCRLDHHNADGPRSGCEPAYDWLYSVEAYTRFFQKLKGGKERVHAALFAGNTSPVSVTTVGNLASLAASCSGPAGDATPAIRLVHFIKRMDGHFSSVCDGDYGSALEAFGGQMASKIQPRCFDAPLLLPDSGLACDGSLGECQMPRCAFYQRCDESMGFCREPDGSVTEERCGVTCLDAVECLVTEVHHRTTPHEQRVDIPKCPRRFFVNRALGAAACEPKDCPCWRINPGAPRQCTERGSPPYRLEIIRKSEQATLGEIVVRCREAPFSWSDPRARDASIHCGAAIP